MKATRQLIGPCGSEAGSDVTTYPETHDPGLALLAYYDPTPLLTISEVAGVIPTPLFMAVL